MAINSIVDLSDYFSSYIRSVFAFNPDNNTPHALAEEVGLSSNNFATPEQVHSNQVQWVEKSGKYKGVDGLITSNRNLILTLKVADCVPVFFYDSQTDIIGLVHSGWRGTTSGIIPNTIELMQQRGSYIGNVSIYMGPAICVCCYEVDLDVASLFNIKAKLKLDNKKWKVDMHHQISLQLTDLGILSHNIHISRLCTFESVQCHSYRRDGTAAGRMYAFSGLI